jgi:hypothetical protein
VTRDRIGNEAQAWLDRNADKIEEYFVERDEYGGPNSPYSIWAYTKPGWIIGGMDCHLIHESNQKAFLEMAKTIEPCNCDACKE